MKITVTLQGPERNLAALLEAAAKLGFTRSRLEAELEMEIPVVAIGRLERMGVTGLSDFRKIKMLQAYNLLGPAAFVRMLEVMSRVGYVFLDFNPRHAGALTLRDIGATASETKYLAKAGLPYGSLLARFDRSYPPEVLGIAKWRVQELIESAKNLSR